MEQNERRVGDKNYNDRYNHSALAFLVGLPGCNPDPIPPEDGIPGRDPVLLPDPPSGGGAAALSFGSVSS
jgi:hypothetical protein